MFNSEYIEVSGINPYLNQGHVKNLFLDFLAYSEKDNLSHTLYDFIAMLLSKYSSVSSNEIINNKVLESLNMTAKSINLAFLDKGNIFDGEIKIKELDILFKKIT